VVLPPLGWCHEEGAAHRRGVASGPPERAGVSSRDPLWIGCERPTDPGLLSKDALDQGQPGEGRERHMDNPVLWVVIGVVGVLLLIFLFRMARGRRGSVGASGGRRGFRRRFRR
jgi:hypothetical protein